jgi:hypothetical protein
VHRWQHKALQLLELHPDIRRIEFSRMTTDPEYLQEVLQHFGITDVEITKKDLEKKINRNKRIKYEAWEDLPEGLRNTVEEYSWEPLVRAPALDNCRKQNTSNAKHRRVRMRSNHPKFTAYVDFLRQKGLYDKVRHRQLYNFECNYIAGLSDTLECKNILEIGRSKGWSFGLFKSLWPEAFVMSIDIKHHPECDLLGKYFDNFEFVTSNSSHLKAVDTVFDLVLIDGDHSYRGCLKDWDNIQKNIDDGTLVLFDNLNHSGKCGKVFYDIRDKYDTSVLKFPETEPNPKGKFGMDMLGTLVFKKNT